MTNGAYGLRLEGAPPAALLTDVPDDWPLWTIARGTGDDTPELLIAAASARVPLHPAGSIEVDRDSRTISYRTPEPLSDDALAHPYLAPAAAIAASWEGEQTFHGGAWIEGGRAWAILGDAAEGKSSLLAALAAAGKPVLCDDLIAIRDDDVLAGPRCVDLRPDAAERLGTGTPLGVVGARERWRVRLDAVAPQVPLGGFVKLDWDEREDRRWLAPNEKLELLIRSLAIVPHELDQTALLELAARPLLRFTRPPGSWNLLGDAATLAASAAAA